MIEVLATASLNSVQDSGRKGQRRHGINTSGAMDRLALAAGNLMVANEGDAAGIEIQLFPMRLKFHTDTVIAITGADCEARLDGQLLPPWWATAVCADQELAVGPPRKGLRSYISVHGGLDVPVVLGSRSTYFRLKVGGHEGRALQRGDRLALPAKLAPQLRDREGFGVIPAQIALPMPHHMHAESNDIVVRVMPSADYDDFPASSLCALWQGPWTVTTQSNRMGYRLKGESLQRTGSLELRSRGIVAGVVQVPPGGQPIIQLSDGNSAGGYPQIGCVIDADLWRLAQAVPGSRLRFLNSTLEEARKAESDIEKYLNRLRRQVRYCNGTL